MAEINLFIYKDGDSRLHRIHPTLKIILLICSSTLIYRGDLLTLCYYSFLIFLTFLLCRLSFSQLLKDLKYIFVIGLFLVLFQVILTNYNRVDIIKSSAVYLLKLGLMILLGTIFTSTTKPDQITPAIYTIIRNKKLAESISLTIRLIPTFIISWKDVEESLNSRGLYLIKNPLRFIKAVSIPILLELFKKADSISMAMDSRCYNGWRKEEITSKKIDPIVTILALLPTLLLIKKLLPLDYSAFFSG